MVVLDGADQLVEQRAVHVVLGLDLVERGDLLFKLRVSLVDALDDGREGPGGEGEGEDAHEHHEHAETLLCHADRSDVPITYCEHSCHREVHG